MSRAKRVKGPNAIIHRTAVEDWRPVWAAARGRSGGAPVTRQPAHATRLPARWTPPSRAMTFCASEDGVVHVLAEVR